MTNSSQTLPFAASSVAQLLLTSSRQIKICNRESSPGVYEVAKNNNWQSKGHPRTIPLTLKSILEIN
jgi:hypothetical protein